jgi:hypothetical protein
MEFDFEYSEMGTEKSKFFVNSVIHSRRCQKCSKIVFVNDFKRCLNCRGIKRVETKDGEKSI